MVIRHALGRLIAGMVVIVGIAGTANAYAARSETCRFECWNCVAEATNCWSCEAFYEGGCWIAHVGCQSTSCDCTEPTTEEEREHFTNCIGIFG